MRFTANMQKKSIQMFQKFLNNRNHRLQDFAKLRVWIILVWFDYSVMKTFLDYYQKFLLCKEVFLEVYLTTYIESRDVLWSLSIIFLLCLYSSKFVHKSICHWMGFRINFSRNLNNNMDRIIHKLQIFTAPWMHSLNIIWGFWFV